MYKRPLYSIQGVWYHITFALGRKEQDSLFLLLILIYILCLWLAVPAPEEEQLTKGRECRSSEEEQPIIEGPAHSEDVSSSITDKFGKFVTFDSNSISEKFRYMC